MARTQHKNLKEGITVAATGAQGMKYKKPKPTNPKPFRLRTDVSRLFSILYMLLRTTLCFFVISDRTCCLGEKNS